MRNRRDRKQNGGSPAHCGLLWALPEESAGPHRSQAHYPGGGLRVSLRGGQSKKSGRF